MSSAEVELVSSKSKGGDGSDTTKVGDATENFGNMLVKQIKGYRDDTANYLAISGGDGGDDSRPRAPWPGAFPSRTQE